MIISSYNGQQQGNNSSISKSCNCTAGEPREGGAKPTGTKSEGYPPKSVDNQDAGSTLTRDTSSGGLNIARDVSMPVEMHSLENPIPRPALTARNLNGSQASGWCELSLWQLQIAGTMLP
jgi:hypothetical protein